MKPVKNRVAGKFVKRKKKKMTEEKKKKNLARWVGERLRS
tara:strand:- start:627 stop:746 length:120 start_codon:yes stop_codon:yes gene_type:complete